MANPAIQSANQSEKAAKAKYDFVAKEVNHIRLADSASNMSVDEIIFKWLDTVAQSIVSKVAFTGRLTPDEEEANRLVLICISSGTRKDQVRDALIDIALGDVLFQSIVYASEYETLGEGEADLTKVRMDRVHAYLDVGVVFRMLGYFGKEAEAPAEELAGMCRATGCGLRVFDHTVQEAQEGLLAFAARFYSGSGAFGPMLDWALASGMTKADLIEEADLIPQHLANLGIVVAQPPPLPDDLSISESQLDYEIEVGLQQDNPLARQRDVRSLAAVYRLRDGEPIEFLERANAIFITANSSLARAATKYFNREFLLEGKRPGVQICMTDITFSTRLWTKLPTRHDLIPRQQVLAQAVSYLRPNRALRESFLQQLNKMVEKGLVSDERATFIRLTSFADRVLAIEYDGRTRRLTQDQAEDVVQSALVSFDKLVRSAATQMAEADTADAVGKVRLGFEAEVRSLRESAAKEAEEKSKLEEISEGLRTRLARIEAGEKMRSNAFGGKLMR